MAIYRAIRRPKIALLLSGQTISRLGDSLFRIALSWWVLKETGSAVVMGGTLIFSFTPMLIFSIIGGVAVDRFPRVMVMLISDVLRGASVFAVAILAGAQRLEVWHIYLFSILFGLVDAFFQPAYTAFLPEIVPQDLLSGANSLTNLSLQFANIAGPGLGAVLVNARGTAFAFALDGVSFMISALCLLPLLGDLASPAKRQKKFEFHREVGAGIRAVLSVPWLWVTISIAALLNVTLSGPINVSLPFLVKDHWLKDVGALGLIYSCISCGSLIGAICLGHLSHLHKRGMLAYGAWFISGVTVLAFGLPIPWMGVLVVAVLNGIAITVFGLVWLNSLQEMVPRELLGRVSSIDNLGSFVLLPLGYGLAGTLTDRFGAPFVFILGGLGTAFLALLGILHPSIRNLD